MPSALLAATLVPDAVREAHLRYALRLEAAMDVRLLRVIRRALKGVASRLALTAAATPISPDDANSISSQWELGISEDILPLLGDVYRTSGGATSLSLVGEFAISPAALAASNHWEEAARLRLSAFGQDLQGTVRSSLIEGMNLGEGIPELQRRVRGVLGVSEARAQAIARTEVISASNAGSLVTATGLSVETKTWLATADVRTRPTHRSADGQTVELDDLFSVGGFPAQYPGDPRLPPEENVNCRCTVIYGETRPCFCTPAWVGTLTASALTAAGEPSCVCTGEQLQGSRADILTAAMEVPMPWHKSNNREDCDGWAVIKDDTDEVVGCHDTEEEADAQLAALFAQEPDSLASLVDGPEWEGILAVEGIESGDGREFAANSLTWEHLPIVLQWEKEGTHGGDHSVTVPIGSVETIERRGGEIWGTGRISTQSTDAQTALALMGEKVLKWVSVVVDSIKESDVELIFPEDGEEGPFGPMLEKEIFHKGRIRAVTITDISAYIEAEIGLVDQLSMVASGPEDADYDNPICDNPDCSPVVLGAIGPHDTGTSEDSWDGPANETRVRSPESLDYFRGIYAWFDSEAEADDDGNYTKNNFRFIHHEISADGRSGAANLIACSTGIGVLNGGRGGTTIPAADKQGVWNHLAAHIRDAGNEPPELLSAATMVAAVEPHTASMVALVPIANDAVRLAVDGGEDVNELHVTLAFLGDATQYDEAKRTEIIEQISAVAKATVLAGNAFNVAMFNPAGDESCWVLGIGGDEIDAIHREVADQLGDRPEEHKPWVPHLTLVYSDDFSLAPIIAERVGSIVFDRLRVAFGEESIDIPLNGAITAAGGHSITLPDRPPAPWFDEPTDVTAHGALTITDEGRLYGYLAPGNVGHISPMFRGRIVPLGSDYGRFHRAEAICEGGQRIPCGVVTMGCNHAPKTASPVEIEQFENTCSVFGKARVGENRHGVWIAGYVLPDVSAEQVERAMACSLSGYWRDKDDRSGTELFSALLVPVPGFPMARKTASVRYREGSLVASAVPVEFCKSVPKIDLEAIQAFHAANQRHTVERLARILLRR